MGLPAYLEDLRLLVEKGGLDERKLLESLGGLLAIVTSSHGRKACAALRLNTRDSFAELRPNKRSQLRAFFEKRLPRVLTAAPSWQNFTGFRGFS